MDVADDFTFPRAPGRGKLWAVVATVALLAGGSVFALGGGAGSGTASPAASPVPAAAPPPPRSNAYDPGDTPVKLREAPPPLQLTTRQSEQAAAGKGARSSDKASSRRKVTSRRPKASRTATKDPLKSSGRSSKYDPLNGAL